MKKLVKYLISFCSIFLIVVIYFYLNPAVSIKQLEIENNIPIKIGPYSSLSGNDSILVYIPYKFRVSNNRLKKIVFGNVMFNNNYYHRDLYFDKNGYILSRMFNAENLEELIFKKQYFKYLQLYYNNEIFPFSDKEYYFYKPFLFKKSIFENLTNQKQYASLVSNFTHHQSKGLYNRSNLTIKKQIIDSLYQSDKNSKIILNYDSVHTNDYSNGYEVEYYLYTDKQTLIDNSKITTEELEKYLLSNPFDK